MNSYERLCKASAEAKLAWTMPSVAENLKENVKRSCIYMNIQALMQRNKIIFLNLLRKAAHLLEAQAPKACGAT